MTRAVWVFAAAMATTSPCMAAELGDALARCAALPSDGERLRCYDRVGRLATPAVPESRDDEARDTVAEPPVIEPEAAVTASDEATEVESVSDVVSADPEVEPTAPQSPTAVSPDAGPTRAPALPTLETVPQESLPQRKPDVPSVSTVDPSLERGEVTTQRDAFGGQKFIHGKRDLNSITAVLTKVEKLPRGNYRLTMNDGQVWQETEYSIRTRYTVGDEVVISRGFMGTYNIESKVTGRHNKVERLQ